MIVYKITNKKNGKIYVGQTINDLEFRFNQHCRKGCYLYEAIKKYGVENFDKEIIDSAITREELDKKETYWIKKLNSIYPNGYNLTYGGVHYEISEETRKKHKQYCGEKHPAFGTHLTEEHKRKLRETFSGEKNPFYGKQHEKHPKGFLGKQHSKESKNKTSKTCKERKINCKKVKVIFTDDMIKIYDSIQEVMKDLNVSYSFCHKLLKSGDEFVMKKNNHNKDLKCFVGIKMFYLDNIEVTHEVKIS